MKTLGELRVGDEFQLVHYDGGYITDIKKHTISIITEIQIGIIIKFFDESNYLRGVTIEKTEYDLLDAPSYYCGSIIADKNHVIELLENDKKKFDEQYNEIYNKIHHG